MKKLLLLPFLLFIISLANAEYNGWFIKFIIEKTDGTKINGYTYVASAYFEQDSINNNQYVIDKLNLLDYNNDSSSIRFYKNRIPYNYYPYNDTEPAIIYSLINETKINIGKVKRIKITEMTDQSYSIGVSNKLTLKDTIWMKTKPVKYESVSIELCDYQLFFHELNPELEKLVAQLKKAQSPPEQNNEKEEVETESDPIDIENSQNEKYILSIIDKIKKYKVIVIGTCTC